MAEQPSLNPSPKARFMSSKSGVEAHNAMLDKPAFQFGVDFALLEYQRQLCEVNADANGAACNHFKLRGALEFVHVLRNLSTVPPAPRPLPTSNLDHKVN